MWSVLLLLLLLLLPPPPPQLLLGTQLTLSSLSSEPSGASPSPGSRCGPDEYWFGRHCCQRCPAGQYVLKPCSSPHTQSECEACDTGMYTGHANSLWSCLLCSTCREDQEMVSDCTPIQDRQCQCKTGMYYCASESCLEGCLRCTRCPEGKVVLQTCNATADTLCGPPSPGSEGRHRWWWMAGWLSSAVVMALVILCIRKPGDGGGQAACGPRAGPVSTGRPYRPGSLVPESSLPFVSSPETRDADAPVPTTGAPHLPEDRQDEASEPLILPGTPHSPAGDGPRPEAEAVGKAGPHAGHHGLTPHPLRPWPEGPAEVLVALVDTEWPQCAAEELGRPARPPYRLGDQVTTLDGLKSKLCKPGLRGCAQKDGKFHFWPRVWAWIAGSLPTHQSLSMRQPVDVSLSRPPPSIPYTPFGDPMDNMSSNED